MRYSILFFFPSSDYPVLGAICVGVRETIWGFGNKPTRLFSVESPMGIVLLMMKKSGSLFLMWLLDWSVAKSLENRHDDMFEK